MSSRTVATDTLWQEYHCPEIASASVPGQFVMLGVGLERPGTWLLPRPFSVGWRSDDGRVGILLRVYGRGTEALSQIPVGGRALLLGPLGKPFRPASEGAVECVAGGVGLAPFIFLGAEEARAGRRIRLLYGERDRAALFDRGLLAELTGQEVERFTEDGSAGTHGRVTAGLDPASGAQLLGCGPTPMLRALAAFAGEHSRALQVSVEEHMGCGIGTCQGCVVPSADGRWIKACVEGPVFDATELDWGRP